MPALSRHYRKKKAAEFQRLEENNFSLQSESKCLLPFGNFNSEACHQLLREVMLFRSMEDDRNP